MGYKGGGAKKRVCGSRKGDIGVARECSVEVAYAWAVFQDEQILVRYSMPCSMCRDRTQRGGRGPLNMFGELQAGKTRRLDMR